MFLRAIFWEVQGQSLEVMSSNFLHFQSFSVIPTCSQDIGAWILALLGQKVTQWMKLLLWRQIYVSRTLLKYFFFSFSENMGWIIQEKVNFDRLMLVVIWKSWLKSTKIWIFVKLWDFISPVAITCTYFFLALVKAIWGWVLIHCGAKIMCKQGPGTDWMT